ncbi:LRC71 protein, partial [Nyctiprogne leucopyga]|nr:LRC71 protein [Nyctiprogne leucopyga]
QLPALAALLARCPRLRTLSLEGNPLPEPAFHMLMGSDSTFNCISDLGAGYIAGGLRLNRSLLSLSLANNDIGDAGAIKLAQVLGPFTLTHTEVVERRQLLLAKALRQSHTVRPSPRCPCSGGHVPSPPLGKVRGSRERAPLQPARQAAPSQAHQESHQEEMSKQAARRSLGYTVGHRVGRGCLIWGVPHSLMGPPLVQAPDPAEPLHPLLDDARQSQGSIILPGNRVLLNLNLSHNRITPRGLSAFLAALEEQQREKKPKVPGQLGLVRLSLEKNLIPPTSPALVRLQELLPPQDPLPKTQEQEEQ